MRRSSAEPRRRRGGNAARATSRAAWLALKPLDPCRARGGDFFPGTAVRRRAMKSLWLLASIVCAVTLAGSPAAAPGTDPGPVLYGLGAPPSEFGWGCFGPCA